MLVQSRRQPLILLITVWTIFLAMGVFLGSIGPALPDFATKTGSTVEAVGAIFTAAFVGTLIAQLASGQIVDRFGARSIVIIGCLFNLAGVAGALTSTELLPLLLFMVVVGLGHGFMDVSSQVYISAAYAHDSVRTLNSLHMFYGVGTVVGPVLVSVTLRTLGSALPAIWLAGLLPLLMIPLVYRLYDDDILSQQKKTIQVHEQTGNRVYVSPLVWMIGLLLLVYVGIEAGVGGWTAVYMTESTGMSAADAALVTSLFWLSFTVGRLLATVAGTRVKAMPLILISGLVTLAGAVLLTVSVGNVPVSIAATLILGIGSAPVYGTAISVTTGSFRASPGRAASFVAALGSLGGLTITPLQGVVIERLGVEWNGWYLIAFSLVFLVLWVVIRALLKRRAVSSLTQ